MKPFIYIASAYAGGDVDADFATLRNLPDRKTFALAATQTRCPAALFALRDGKAASARDFFGKATLQAVERAMGI